MKYLKKHKIIFIILFVFIFTCLIIVNRVNDGEEIVVTDIQTEIEELSKIEEEIDKNPEIVKDTILYKVDVKGAVKNPGVYEVEKAKRVIDAINKAGGLLYYANTSTINLSKYVEDEMVIIVYTNDEINDMKEGNIKIEYIEKECVCPEIKNDACINDNIQETETTQININTDSLEELMTIPKIGESKAQDIIKYREENGGFKNIEEIKNINGIKDATYETIKDYITI